MAAMVNSSTAALGASIALLVGMLMFSTPLILVFIIVLLILWLSTRRPPGLPPGPPRLPLVGNMFQMDKYIRVAFSNLRRQYGDIFSIYLFHQPFIVLNGYNVIKEALVKNADLFSCRPYTFLTEDYCKGKGIMNTGGVTWRDIRKFTVTSLRELGMANIKAEERIQQELTLLLKALEDQGSKEFDCKDLIYTATSNIICGLCFGKRQYEYNDPRYTKLSNAIDDIFFVPTELTMVNLFPALRLLPGDLFYYKRLAKAIAVMKKEIARLTEERINAYDGENVEDFTTAFLKEVRCRKKDDKAFDESHLDMALTDVYMAGTTDAGNNLVWSVLYLLHYPEVQEKCFQLIKQHIGLDRRPTMMDKPNLPYVEAVYSEILRCVDMVPTGLHYTVDHDVQFMGYTFPKGVPVIPMINSVLYDQAAWGDPQNFRPERFLNDEGKFQKREEFMPFSIGRRSCLGQSLFRVEQFLILTTLIQRFKFVPPSGKLRSLYGIVGIVDTARPFKCKVIPRNI
ncbi:cytochrome P450 2C3-like [Haliotis asinina]|uniref:cytochrome P450 2C3-like n=1 Tax=Haliotis asinina TaxID=109174 RepID=UPI003531D96C